MILGGEFISLTLLPTCGSSLNLKDQPATCKLDFLTINRPAQLHTLFTACFAINQALKTNPGPARPPGPKEPLVRVCRGRGQLSRTRKVALSLWSRRRSRRRSAELPDSWLCLGTAADQAGRFRGWRAVRSDPVWE